MNLPPTSFITDKDPSEGWSREDKKLAVAYTILQKETCQRCGQPLWICRSNNKNLLFKVKSDICYGAAELEKHQKKNKKELRPGEYEFPVPYMRPDGPLPSRRDYLQQMSED